MADDIFEATKVIVINQLADGTGRELLIEKELPFAVELDWQDQDKTLKISLKQQIVQRIVVCDRCKGIVGKSCHVCNGAGCIIFNEIAKAEEPKE